MNKHLDVVIIGAGTAGLNAMGQVRKHTNNFLLIDGGDALGTTCARVGCMPSKALIHIAETYHGRYQFSKFGINGDKQLSLDSSAALERVQDVRDILVDRVLSNSIDQLGDKFLNQHAQFIGPNTLKAGNDTITADKIIIAVGSRPIIPFKWRQFSDRVLTTDTFFEQSDLPQSMAIIGLGVIGLELGQALSHLGVEVTGVDALETIAGLKDPKINQCAINLINKNFPLVLGQQAVLESIDDKIQITAGDEQFTVDRVLVSVGRRSNIDSLTLDKIGVTLNENGLPAYNLNSMALNEAPHIFIAGDANAESAILHEASYEGKIAGLNAVSDSVRLFKRYVPLHITFSNPNICQVGQSLAELNEEDIVLGDFPMGPHGRALVMANNKGLVHIYADKHSGKLLGACMVAPRAEHLAHLLAWSIEQGLSLQDMLRYPFYHPVFEEALQSAIRSGLAKMDINSDLPHELTILR